MRLVASVFAAIAAVGGVATNAYAAAPGTHSLYLCGSYNPPTTTQAGNSQVDTHSESAGPAQVSSGNTYQTQSDCSNQKNSNGNYTWTLGHSTDFVSPGNGKVHGTEHGTWTVTLSDGTNETGIYNGKIAQDTCGSGQDGQCYEASGRINSVGQARSGQPNTEHWNGEYSTTVTASGCGSQSRCSYSFETSLSYRVLGSS